MHSRRSRQAAITATATPKLQSGAVLAGLARTCTGKPSERCLDGKVPAECQPSIRPGRVRTKLVAATAGHLLGWGGRPFAGCMSLQAACAAGRTRMYSYVM